MFFIATVLFFLNIERPSLFNVGRTSQQEEFSADFSAHNIFKTLDDELGTWNETASDPMVYFIWVTTPSGNTLPVIFTEEQWKMLHEVATMSECSVEDVIIDVTRERYSL
jgi:hypothetical protein